MKIPIKPDDGILILIISRLLFVVAYPLEYAHHTLKPRFVSAFSNSVPIDWREKPLEGIFIELWTIVWTTLNVFLVLPCISRASGLLLYALGVVLLIRSADFAQTFVAINFKLVRVDRRSTARSYALLLFAVLELGAILSAFHFLITKDFFVGTEHAEWTNVYFYTLRNILTVGGGDIPTSTFATSLAFGALRIIQPMVGVLVLTVAIARTVDKE